MAYPELLPYAPGLVTSRGTLLTGLARRPGAAAILLGNLLSASANRDRVGLVADAAATRRGLCIDRPVRVDLSYGQATHDVSTPKGSGREMGLMASAGPIRRGSSALVDRRWSGPVPGGAGLCVPGIVPSMIGRGVRANPGHEDRSGFKQARLAGAGRKEWTLAGFMALLSWCDRDSKDLQGRTVALPKLFAERLAT